MAEYTTVFFPNNKNFVPTNDAIERAVANLNDVYLGHYSATSRVHAAPHFINSGADFDRFVCPACGKTVAAHDGSDWWYFNMWGNIVEETQLITVPCCGASVPFNELGVSDHTGFATFQIDLEGAGEEYLPDAVQQEKLNEIIGCNMRYLISVVD